MAPVYFDSESNAPSLKNITWPTMSVYKVQDGGWQLGDLFGNGFQVFYTRTKAGTHYVMRLKADGDREITTWPGGHGVADGGWQLGDLFGDGRQVYYTLTKAGTHYATRLNYLDFTVKNWTWTGGHKVYDGGWQLADLFGDGRPVFYTHTKTGTHYATRLNENGTVQNWTWTGGHKEYDGGWQLGDLFGDGRPVFYTHTKAGAHYATRLNADGTVQNWTWSGGHGVYDGGWQLGDIFGDGRQVYFTHAKAGTHYATRLNVDGTVQNWTWTGGHGVYDGGWQLGDIFGEGRQVYYTLTNAGTHYATSFLRVKPDSVVKIRNALGAAITITEKAGSDLGRTIVAETSYPKRYVEVPIYVVTSTSVDNGIGGTQRTDYRYGKLMAEVGTGRGMLGFDKIEIFFGGMTSSNPDDPWTATEYRQDWPYVGLPSKMYSLRPGPINSNQTEITYGCLDPATGGACTVAAGKRYFPYASQTVVKGLGLSPVTTTQQFDVWGNPTVVKVSAADGHEKITTNRMLKNPLKNPIQKMLMV